MSEEKKEDISKINKIIDGLNQFRSGDYPGTYVGDKSEVMKLTTQARVLISKVAGENSEYSKQYTELFKKNPRPDYYKIQSLKGILKALSERSPAT